MEWAPPHLTGGQPQQFNGRTTEMLLGQVVNELHHLRWDTHEIKGHLRDGHKRMDQHEDRLEALEKTKGEAPAKPNLLSLALSAVPVAQMTVGLALIVLSSIGYFTAADVKEIILAFAGK